MTSASKPVDNAKHEKRSDVVVFSSETLNEPLEVLGEPSCTIHLRSNRQQTDLFVRLCDVTPDGRSITVCDGVRRIGGPGTVETDPVIDSNGVREIKILLWPTAHRFGQGHRIRVQISSGAHPRYARNPGSSEALASARELLVAQQEILHDRMHPSGIALPVLGN